MPWPVRVVKRHEKGVNPEGGRAADGRFWRGADGRHRAEHSVAMAGKFNAGIPDNDRRCVSSPATTTPLRSRATCLDIMAGGQAVGKTKVGLVADSASTATPS